MKIVDSVGLLIIGFAVVETAKFIAEEEVVRKRELRSAVESRRSPTKFITIMVIAGSLEALVMVFKTSRTSIPDTMYPAALFVASMLAFGVARFVPAAVKPHRYALQQQGGASSRTRAIQEGGFSDRAAFLDACPHCCTTTCQRS
jgi:hypothetical protein